MRLYYTVSSATGDPQSKYSLSLGGFKSSTPVPNDVSDSFFSDISMFGVRSGYIEAYIGLIFTNETGGDLADVEFYYTKNTDSYSNLEIAVVDLVGGAMEQIPSNMSKPLSAEFHTPMGVENKVSLGAMDDGESIGVWFKRTLLTERIKEDQNSIYEADPNDPYRFLEVKLNTQDTFNLYFLY